MKRKVAGGMSGKFSVEYVRFQTGRIRITTQSVYTLVPHGDSYAGSCCTAVYAGSETSLVSSFFITDAGNTRRRGKFLMEKRFSRPPNSTKEAKEWQSTQKIRIKIKGYEHATVDAAAAKIVEAAKRSGSQVSGPIPLPTDKEIITILRATHKYKDSREQFERRTHKRLIDVVRPTQKTTEALQKLEIPAGVDIVMELK